MISFVWWCSFRYTYAYQEPTPVEHLVRIVCDLKQSYTQYGGNKHSHPIKYFFCHEFEWQNRRQFIYWCNSMMRTSTVWCIVHLWRLGCTLRLPTLSKRSQVQVSLCFFFELKRTKEKKFSETKVTSKKLNWKLLNFICWTVEIMEDGKQQQSALVIKQQHQFSRQTTR